MSLSRSPSPNKGGGWSSPGLAPRFDNLSGRSSPRKSYQLNGGFGSKDVTWATAKARSDEVNGYPSFSTKNNGFFSRHARQISKSLPSFVNGAEKEKLGRGRWLPNSGSRTGRILGFIGRTIWPMHRAYRRASVLGGGSKFVIILAANQGGGVMEWKGPREWAIERDSVKNKKKYAKKWGYNLEIVDMSTKKRYAHEWRESWEKVDTIRNSMRKYPKAQWLVLPLDLERFTG
ncbi:MAG: hypothetical protein Q9212_004341 [Teloschistes hypoglaucus]